MYLFLAVLGLALSANAKNLHKDTKKVYISYVESDSVKSKQSAKIGQKRNPAKVSDDAFREAIDETSLQQKSLQHKISKDLNVKRDNVRIRTDLSELIEKNKPQSENIVVQSDVFEKETVVKKNNPKIDNGLRRISEEVNKALEK